MSTSPSTGGEWVVLARNSGSGMMTSNITLGTVGTDWASTDKPAFCLMNAPKRPPPVPERFWGIMVILFGRKADRVKLGANCNGLRMSAS